MCSYTHSNAPPLSGRRRLPFLFHLIPFQKYPSLIKNRRNRTATKTILFCPLLLPTLISKIYILFWLFTKTLFSHKRLSHYIFGLFSEKATTTPELFRFSHFLASFASPHTIYIYKCFSKFKTIFVGQVSGHLCWLERGSIGFAEDEGEGTQDVYFHAIS